jgi:hypothetical protein
LVPSEKVIIITLPSFRFGGILPPEIVIKSPPNGFKSSLGDAELIISGIKDEFAESERGIMPLPSIRYGI